MQMSCVNGFAYRSVTPVSDDEIPERFQRAEEAFEKKLRREQLREWDEVGKPAAIKTHRALQSVDPDALSSPELLAYVTKCRDHHARMIYQHMRFTGAAMLSVGDLLAHLADWASVPPSEVLGMMRGAAPVSAGASSELDRLVTAFAEDAAAREIHFIDAGFGEMVSFLSGSGGPSAGELAARFEYRTCHTAKDAPEVLGPHLRRHRIRRGCRRGRRG